MNKINIVVCRMIVGFVDLLIHTAIIMLIFEVFVGEITPKDWRLYAVFLPLMILRDVFGQSIGKLLFGVEIVDFRTGDKAKWYQRILKNITVVLTVFVEVPMVLFRKDHRKLGDIIAKTDVRINENGYILHLVKHLFR